MADSSLRGRALLDEYLAVVVGLLVVLALLGGWATYTAYADPGTSTEERTVSSWETAGNFTHSAVVTEPNPLYEEGRTLSNQSVYFTRASPWLNGTYALAFDASDGGELEGAVALTLVVRSVEREQGEVTTVFWQRTRPLETVTGTLEPGETLSASFSFNASAAVNRTERIQEALGASPGDVEAVVRASVDLQGTVNGRQVEASATHPLPVALDGNTYRPGSVSGLGSEYETTGTFAVEHSYGPPWTVGGPLLVLLGVGGLAGLALAHRRDELGLREGERERLAYEDDRTDFEEWISTIQLPPEAFDRPRAHADSLAALVDFAIDTDKSVVADPDSEAYYVLHDDFLYTYTPPVLDGTGDDDAGTDEDGEPGTAEDADGGEPGGEADEPNVRVTGDGSGPHGGDGTARSDGRDAERGDDGERRGRADDGDR